jgi:hypothetical protein
VIALASDRLGHQALAPHAAGADREAARGGRSVETLADRDLRAEPRLFEAVAGHVVELLFDAVGQ